MTVLVLTTIVEEGNLPILSVRAELTRVLVNGPLGNGCGPVLAVTMTPTDARLTAGLSGLGILVPRQARTLSRLGEGMRWMTRPEAVGVTLLVRNVVPVWNMATL